MLRVIMTSDHEIHGNGEGSPQELMVATTDRLLESLRPYGAKLTIMADVAEIMRFQRHREDTGRDDFGTEAIGTQLKSALNEGHDVQLHIHPSYLDARWRGGRWEQDYASYDLARLGYARLVAVIRTGKSFLEGLLRPTKPSYRCWVFRAANWSMHPSQDIVRALTENGIAIDTSVFKYGRRSGLVEFDYADAWSDVVPWPASTEDVCRRDVAGALFECPIYAEHRWLPAFMSVNRVYRWWQSRQHRLGQGAPPSLSPHRSVLDWARRVWTRHAWKLDFNQCSGRQLIRGLERAEVKVSGAECELPLVLIGHSKLFTRQNARSLTPFLEFVAAHPDRFAFGTFADLDWDAIRSVYHSPMSERRHQRLNA